ncbi:MAG: UDP-N-acetylmuramoyl-tripeptide--D-alanyl-D-alanine ligase [Bacteroidaceae bacterium]|nr:UDP-N-acetylmuramoyl-tripeptide--D-alanyl-D-alanine ligase [Bacteroidaceae bacterium]
MDIQYIYNNVFLAHPVVSTDSRHCPEGCMFFALKGERFDGNQYAAMALEGGAAVAVVDAPSVAASLPGRALLVDDVLATLQALAREHRRRFRGPVIQVTGTNGKTTTKELLAAVLGRRYHVLWTQGNLNNHIGVPLTLLRLRPAEHEVAVVETGANHPGEIAALCGIVEPDFGLITNVGRAHLAGFGSFDGVKRTKGELYDFLSSRPGGNVFVNTCDADLSAMAAARFGLPLADNARIIPYVSGRLSATTGAELSFCWEEGADCAGVVHEVRTHLVGNYNLANLRAAVTVGLAFGVTPADIDAALAAYQPTLGRSEFKTTPYNALIVDAYNANPTSMRAALDNFASIRHERKMVILGDMRELGSVSHEEHCRVVEQVLKSDVQEAWFVGEEFAAAVSAVGSTAPVVTLPDVAAAKARIAASRPEGFLILVKGSNGTRLFELPELL